MSIKIGYRVLNGYRPDSTSTAYLDCDVAGCPHEVHTGIDKYNEHDIAVHWNEDGEGWFEVPMPSHICTDE